uniref:Uncharacterized protein n=1 Tax=Oryza meridionalis TaxID=40149 RepID=A0A0E0EDE1_9ORYZ
MGEESEAATSAERSTATPTQSWEQQVRQLAPVTVPLPPLSHHPSIYSPRSLILRRRRIPLPADAPRGKLHEVVLEEEEASSTASVESRFFPPAKLGPSLGVLAASSGFFVGAGGADPDNGENRSSSSSSQ